MYLAKLILWSELIVSRVYWELLQPEGGAYHRARATISTRPLRDAMHPPHNRVLKLNGRLHNYSRTHYGWVCRGGGGWGGYLHTDRLCYLVRGPTELVSPLIVHWKTVILMMSCWKDTIMAELRKWADCTGIKWLCEDLIVTLNKEDVMLNILLGIASPLFMNS